MEYSRLRAVVDGVEVQGEVYRIPTQITPGGSHVDAGFWIGKRERSTRKQRWEQLDDDFSYDLSGHVVCEGCEARMSAVSYRGRSKCYSYYVCRLPRAGMAHASYTYRSEMVNQIAWAWVKQPLLDPEAIGAGLAADRLEQEAKAGPITMHITATEGLLIEKRATLQRLQVL